MKYSVKLYPFILLSLLCVAIVSFSQPRILDSSTHHLRIGDEVEWEDFANSTSKAELNIHFNIVNNKEHTLSLVQVDVRQDWDVLVNGQKIGSLIIDGNGMRIYYKLLPEVLQSGQNKLTIKTVSNIPDDVFISEIVLYEHPVETLLSEAEIDIEVIDHKNNTLVPARVTIVDHKNALQSTGTRAAEHLAIRPGFVYTGNGKASILVPAGNYTLYAGRGFEYSVDSASININAGERLSKKFILKQEVETNGWISSDTHIHTLTHSGHGDATDRERALTIAGEGVELPIITEHNFIPDFTSVVKSMNLHKYFSPVHGAEVTTAVGHFNVFPLKEKGIAPNHRIKNWNELSENFRLMDSMIIILNHARDIHNGFRPFDQKKHIAIAGMNLDNWKLPANAMEVVNSGALQSDPMLLFYDWFGMMNRGIMLTPVGASDSHDVSRYLVGQARTYTKTTINDNITNMNEVIANFKNGSVMVSFGLLPKIIVNKKYGPGELVPRSNQVVLNIEVHGPGWIIGERIGLYVNGTKIREQKISKGSIGGIKWKGEWKLPNTKQDVFLVVIAEGTGKNLPYWPIVKPYQAVNKSWKPYTIGSSGAVWIDADGDGKPTSANDYAKKLLNNFNDDFKKLFTQLAVYDEAVAIQVAALLHERGVDVMNSAVTSLLSQASNSTKEGFRKFSEALNQSK